MTEYSEEQASAQALNDEEMNMMLEQICTSKAEEFQLFGYDGVTGQDVWNCVSSRYKTTPPIHRIVNDILSLRPTQFMNWMTLSVWKSAEKENHS